jgi:hypothetical protein
MTVYRPDAVSRAMLHTWGMQSFNDNVVMNRESNSKSALSLAALDYMGTSRKCGIPVLEEAALALATQAQANTVYCHGANIMSERFKITFEDAMDLLVRDQLQQHFKDLLIGSGLEQGVLGSLEELLFGLLYPNPGPW